MFQELVGSLIGKGMEIKRYILTFGQLTAGVIFQIGNSSHSFSAQGILGLMVACSRWRLRRASHHQTLSLWGAELGWRGQWDWEEELEKLQYQALKKCVNATHGSKRELINQIGGAESPRMVRAAAQARLMGKIMRDTSTLGDLLNEDEKGRNREEGRAWDDFGEPTC